ncbi:MAG: serpin family protein [Chloroflexota bacterium]
MEQDFKHIYDASNRFGLNLLKVLARDELPENIFFSPLSISMCLTIAANGANDQTLQEMLRMLELNEFSLNEINSANQYLISEFTIDETNKIEADSEPGPEPNPDDIVLIKKRRVPRAELDAAYRVIDIIKSTSDEKVWIAQLGEDYFRQMRAAQLVMASAEIDQRFRLSLANSLWVKQGIEFASSFLATTRDTYNAEVASVDFRDKATPEIINGWISRVTQGTIREMVGEISPATVFMLANAIYFKAFWKHQFSKAKTKQEKFTLITGEQTDCFMMHRQGNYHYWEDNDLQMISIPYESVAQLDLGMYIILPKRSQDLHKLISELSAEKWDALIDQVHRNIMYGEFSLPRFKAEYERNLTNDLNGLGIAMAFTPHADFSAMSAMASELWISQVAHKAFIKVDEEGTEAAAVTRSMYVGGISEPQRVFKMIVDHPFIYAIRDHKTGALLFMGVTMQPS